MGHKATEVREAIESVGARLLLVHKYHQDMVITSNFRDKEREEILLLN